MFINDNALFVNARIVQVSASLWYSDQCVLIQQWEREKGGERERERQRERKASVCGR